MSRIDDLKYKYIKSRFIVQVFSDVDDIINGLINFNGEKFSFNYDYESQNLILEQDDDYFTSVFLDDNSNYIEYDDLQLGQNYIDYLVENFINFLVEYNDFVAYNN